MRGVETHNDRSKMEFHNQQILNYRYLNKVLQNLHKKLGNNENSSQFAMEAIKDQCTDVGIVNVIGKAAIHLGPKSNEDFEVYKNTNFEEIQSLFGITQRLTSEHSEEIFNVKTN